MRLLIFTICLYIIVPGALAQTLSKFHDRVFNHLSLVSDQWKKERFSLQFIDINDLDSFVYFTHDPGYYEPRFKSILDIQDSLLLEQLQQVWENNTWVNDELDIFTHDEFGNEIGDLWQRWNIDAWENTANTTVTYNDANLATEYVIAFWEDTVWVNSSRFVVQYDTNLNAVVRESFTWDGMQWEPHQKQTDTYDDQNMLIESLYETFYEGDYINETNSIYIYNDEGVLAYKINQGWNAGGWEDRSRSAYSFDANGLLLSDTTYSRNNDAWVPVSLYSNEYDDLGNWILFAEFIYHEGMFVPTYRLETSFIAKDLIDYEVFRQFDIASQSWINQDSTQYYYRNTISVPDTEKIPGLTVFPNPVNDVLHIEIPEGYSLSGPASLVFAINGRIIVKEILRGRKISTHSLTPGSYLLLLPLNNLQVTVPFIKQ